MELRLADEQLANELDQVGQILAHSCFRDSNDAQSEKDAQRYRRSAEKWEELVQCIRQLPGFGRFLLPTPISTLLQSSA